MVLHSYFRRRYWTFMKTLTVKDGRTHQDNILSTIFSNVWPLELVLYAQNNVYILF